MDASSRYSAETAALDTVMEAAIEVLYSHWIYPVWAPKSIHFDKAFGSNYLKKYLSLQDINVRPISARRHDKNVIELKHKVIRDIFYSSNRIMMNSAKNLATQRTISMSKHLYGDDICSSHE